ncbi:uncharacterized protein LOC121430442 [Lytechinus variegatus]|uniref:uncharacterized protein LOC121430442 n=1 Tax=Lytechinus variegatus TaxID=7654 RepID=UPI001BB1EF1D|nr:uncharacterized protein LOC121430442 [Lytechinus variegatus]
MTSSATVSGTVSTMPFQTTCSRPQPRFGTRYNGTMTIYYSPGDVLEIKCDTGFKVNFEPPTIICMNDGRWKPSNVSCEIDSGNPNRLAEPKTIGGAVGGICLVILLIVIIIVVVRRRKRHPVKTLHGDKQLDDPYMDLVPTASPSSPYETLGTGSMGEALGNLYENGPVATQCQYANQIQNQDQHTYDFI